MAPNFNFALSFFLWQPTDWPLTRYGNWDDPRTDRNRRYGIPPGLSGSDYSGTLAEVSNARVFAERYADGKDRWWCQVIGGCGTFAIVIDSLGALESLPESLIEDLATLGRGELLDDDDHTQLEQECFNAAWSSTDGPDFMARLEARFEIELPDRPEIEVRARALADSVGDRIGVYYCNEEGASAYINLDNLVQNVTAEEFDQLSVE